MNPTRLEIREAKAKLQEGNYIFCVVDKRLLALFDSSNYEAIKRLEKISEAYPYLECAMLIDSDMRMNRLLPTVPSLAWDLQDSANGPLILRLPGTGQINTSLLFEDGSVAVLRVGDESLTRAMHNWPIQLAGMMVYNEDDELCIDWNEYPADVLTEVEYVLNLPDQNPATLARPIPTIALGAENEVKIIRS